MYVKISAIIGVITGLCLIIFRHSFSKSILRGQIDKSKKEKNIENFKRLKEMRLDGFLSRFLGIQVAFIGTVLVLMYIPTFFPQSRRVIYTIVEFLVFSVFSVGGAGLILGTLLRRFLFGKIEKYMHEKQALQVFTSNGSVRNFPEICGSNAENGEKIEDPILKALQKKSAIKAIICFVILYLIFLSSFFILVNTVK